MRVCPLQPLGQPTPAHYPLTQTKSVYVFGGQSQKDRNCNKDADVYDPAADAVKKVDVNAALSEPTFCNMYATMFVLPQGKLAVFNHNHAQVGCCFCLFVACCVPCVLNAAGADKPHNGARAAAAARLCAHAPTQTQHTPRSSTP